MPRKLPPPLADVTLETGDRLNREEFHHLYSLRPDIGKAELVDGVAYVTMRATAAHGIANASLGGWMGLYRAYRDPSMHLALHATILMDGRSEVQPDVVAFRDATLGDRIGLTADGFLEGTPDLIAEVTESSASYDLHDKLRVYERTGVSEYIVWLLHECQMSWFRLVDGRYVEVQPDERGIIESALFPGLRLPVDKLLAGDDAGVLAALGLPTG